jgi:hypothetical protein
VNTTSTLFPLINHDFWVEKENVDLITYIKNDRIDLIKIWGMHLVVRSNETWFALTATRIIPKLPAFA